MQRKKMNRSLETSLPKGEMYKIQNCITNPTTIPHSQKTNSLKTAWVCIPKKDVEEKNHTNSIKDDPSDLICVIAYLSSHFLHIQMFDKVH